MAKRMWHKDTMEFYLSIKPCAAPTPVTAWWELEDIYEAKSSQTPSIYSCRLEAAALIDVDSMGITRLDRGREDGKETWDC